MFYFFLLKSYETRGFFGRNILSIERVQRAVLNFVLMRAFRRGIVKRNDILRAFEGLISETRASELLSAAVGKNPRLLERKGYSVIPKIGAPMPSLASEEQLMKAIFSGNDAFADIGLCEHELPRQRVEWTNNYPKSPSIFSSITQAITNETPLLIQYVTLKRGDRGARRSIFPVGLQRVGDQWRLVAYDLDRTPPVQRAFVLSRIVDAAPSVAKVPKSIKHFSFNAAQPVKAQLHPDFTEEQRSVLEHELSICNEHRIMPPSEEFEFLRRYSEIEASREAVWPVIVRNKAENNE